MLRMRNSKKALPKFIIVLFVLFLSQLSFSQTETVQDNPLSIYHTSIPPTIDGIGNDLCWQSVKWQSIGQVWIPFNGSVSASDYSGRYKVIWSSATNLLYFLIEINDDVFVDGYQPSINPGTGYNFDISEVFIDENRSRGEHRYDSATTNAENAFAYHMYAAFPPEGGVTTTPYIEDMVGTQANSKWINYASHFPEFALRKTGNTMIREFSLIVYNDTYSETNKDAARVKLQAGKEMGLSVAYCDNDGLNENPKVRDNMFGSVSEPSPGNLHWMNADYFGKAVLVSESGTEIKKSENIPVEYELMQNYPNPFNPETVISYRISSNSQVTLKVFDLLGREVSTLVDEYQNPGIYSVSFNASHLDSFISAGRQNREIIAGVYFYTLRVGNFVSTKKMLLLE